VAAPCGSWNWKYWKKGANGCADDWSKSSKIKPTATAEFFPLTDRKARHRRQRVMTLRTVVGLVKLQVWHGRDPQDEHWGCPIRERWGLQAHQQMSPALVEKLAFTATMSLSYEAAAQVAGKWGCPVDDAVIHALVQRVGAQAEAQTQERLKQLPQEQQPGRRASEVALLMVDGWFARFRGAGWGKKKTRHERTEWREIKNGVFYLQEQAGRTEGGRGVVTDKVVVRTRGDATDLGQRLHWEALRGGLGRSQEQLVLGDGIAWIWNLKASRWPAARELLDFWHGSQHLWSLGHACHGRDRAAVQPWVEQRLHNLRHGQEQRVLKGISRLKVSRSQAGQIVSREKNYFAGHAGRMNYEEIADRGWPIGSGPVESSCRQDQRRFKGPGQSWSAEGFDHLSALDQARRNNHWDELWFTT
jgi:hypothetical protein